MKPVYDLVIEKEKLVSEETKEEVKTQLAEDKKQKLLSRVKFETEESPSEPKIEEVPTV